MHKSFVDKTHALTDACLDGEVDVEDVSAFLVSWLRNHIAIEDVKIVCFSNSRKDSQT